MTTNGFILAVVLVVALYPAIPDARSNARHYDKADLRRLK